MKTFLRALAGFLLCAMLFTFTLWRNDAFPDLSGITAFVQDTAGRLDTLTQMQGSSAGMSGARPADSGAQFPEYTLSEEIDPELEAAICNAITEHAAEVDLARFRLNEDSLQAVVSAIRFTHPELFYIDKNFTYQTKSGVIQVLKPQYIYDKAQTDVMMAEYEAMVAQIVAGVPADGTDFDKLLYLHDYFVQNYCYDYTYTIRDAYTFFKQKTGVCQAYMLALIAVAEELGIESIPVTSNRMNHAWNLVKLGEAWYHMDITWDDAVSYPSYTSYAYFLQSDAGIIAIDADKINEATDVPDWHCDWAATQSATDTRYDNAAWRSIHTPMVKGNGTYYCVVSERNENERNVCGAVYSGTDPAALTRLFSINGVWREKGALSYVDCYAGLAVYGDELIYNTNNTLRAYHLTTGVDRLIGFVDVGSTESVFGICDVSSTGTVSCVVSDVAGGGEYRIVTCQI